LSRPPSPVKNASSPVKIHRSPVNFTELPRFLEIVNTLKGEVFCLPPEGVQQTNEASLLARVHRGEAHLDTYLDVSVCDAVRRSGTSKTSCPPRSSPS
jgi:hypothetical protein